MTMHTIFMKHLVQMSSISVKLDMQTLRVTCSHIIIIVPKQLPIILCFCRLCNNNSSAIIQSVTDSNGMVEFNYNVST